MANGSIGLNPGTGGKAIDTEEVTIGLQVVQRERNQWAGASPLEIARVMDTNPDGSEYAGVVRTIPSNIPQPVVSAAPSTMTLDVVPASITPVNLALPDATRRELLIFNNSAIAFLWIKLGDGADPGDCNFRIAPRGDYPLKWSGKVTGVWTQATGILAGAAHITSFHD